jgi:hypothetical protein
MDKTEEKKSNEGQKAQQGEVFNPKRVPTYLGIFAAKNIDKDISKYVSAGLVLAKQKFPEDQGIDKCLDGMGSNKPSFEVIKDPHVTTIFVGNNTSQTKSECYTTFKENLKMEIDICAMAVVPGKIATGICFPDQSVIKIENEFPHVTLMKGSWAPKMSNDLLVALCSKGGPLNKEWANGDLKKLEDGFADKYEVKVGKETVTAYVVRPSKFVMHSVTKAWN